MSSYLLAICTALVWGIVPVFEKMGLARLSPSAGIFIRCLAVFSGSLVLLAVKPGLLGEIRGTPVKYVLLIAGGGFVANFLGQLLQLRDCQILEILWTLNML